MNKSAQFWGLIILAHIMTLTKEPIWHVIYLVLAIITLGIIIFDGESE